MFVLALDRFRAELSPVLAEAVFEADRFAEKYKIFCEHCSEVVNALVSTSLLPSNCDLTSDCVRRLEHEAQKVSEIDERFVGCKDEIKVCEARLQQVVSSPPSMVMLDGFLDEARQEIVLEMQAVIQTFKQDSTSMDEIVREIEKLNLSLREAISNIGRVVSEGMVAMVAVVAVAVVIYFFVVRLLGLVNGN